MAERDSTPEKIDTTEEAETKDAPKGPVTGVVGILRNLNPKKVKQAQIERVANGEPESIDDPLARRVVASACGTLLVGALLAGILLRGGGDSGSDSTAGLRSDSDEAGETRVYQGKHGISIGECAFGGRVVIGRTQVHLSAGEVALRVRGVTREKCFDEATEAVIKTNTGPNEYNWDTNYDAGEVVLRPARLLPEGVVIPDQP